MTKLRHLSLRWRLALAFLVVSAAPVLVASYVAATVISGAFQRNVERWLDEAVRFLAVQTADAVEEADKSAAVIAAALASRGSADALSGDPIRSFADLLASVGYDLVQIDSEDGEIKYGLGEVEIAGTPPRRERRSVLAARLNGAPVLVVGAVRSFQVGGRPHFVLIANLIDEKFFKLSGTITSLDIRVFGIANGEPVALSQDDEDQKEIPPQVLKALAGGAASAVAPASAKEDLARAFVGLRDDEGNLIGIITCRLAGGAATFERLAEWQLFLGLAAVAGLLSLLVGALVAERVSRPVHALTRGVRAVAAGDYGARVREEGGRDLEELASGFNTMTDRLERLQRMEVQMRRQQQLAALGEAAAVIAHEIRNPLGIIKTSSQVVRMRSKLKPSEDRLIDFILEEVARIDRLVQEILDYVRPKEFSKKPLDLFRDVVERAVAYTAVELERHGIACAVERPGDSARVLGDPDQLYQALLNIILNAVDAMPKGGRLSITVRSEPDGVMLKVEDDGLGMAPEVAERVFDPFFTTKAKGAGLGLAKTRAIVEEHGGEILCESAPGSGTAVMIRLPALQVEEALAAVHPGR